MSKTNRKKSTATITKKKVTAKRAAAAKKRSRAQTSSGALKLPRVSAAKGDRAQQILKDLYKHYPDAHCELQYASPHELLIATILSAQATDVGVNKATPTLFKRFPTPAEYAKSSPGEIEKYVNTLNFYRNKAKAIHESMKSIVENFGGEVPKTMEELLTLRGVARKTANVVLGNAFGINEGVVVDTHVMRLAQRFGLTKETDPKKIELELMALFPREDWTMLSHMLILHGRYACKARGGTCHEHPLCLKYCSNAKVAAKMKRAKPAD